MASGGGKKKRVISDQLSEKEECRGEKKVSSIEGRRKEEFSVFTLGTRHPTLVTRSKYELKPVMEMGVPHDS